MTKRSMNYVEVLGSPMAVRHVNKVGSSNRLRY
jgi:hypothetical protein